MKKGPTRSGTPQASAPLRQDGASSPITVGARPLDATVGHGKPSHAWVPIPCRPEVPNSQPPRCGDRDRAPPNTRRPRASPLQAASGGPQKHEPSGSGQQWAECQGSPSPLYRPQPGSYTRLQRAKSSTLQRSTGQKNVHTYWNLHELLLVGPMDEQSLSFIQMRLDPPEQACHFLS